MKKNAYTIQDKIFMDALALIEEFFGDLPYAIVGGGATQAYAAYVTCERTGLSSIKDLNGLSLFLRRTGDIDLSFDYPLTELLQKWNFVIEQASGSYSYHNFEKRFILQRHSQRMNLNYQVEPEDLKGISPYYKDIIHSAISLELPYQQKKIRLKIAKPEYLIASKLIRAKPKDQTDIALLLKSMETDQYPFDSEEVRSIIKSVNLGDRYDILMDLMDSI